MSLPTQTPDPTTLFSARGLVVAITGGGTGIGLSIATALHRTSARAIYLLGRRESVLTAAATSLDPTLTTVIPLVCDINSLASIRSAVARVERDHGYLDVLVNNAGREGPHTKAAFEAQTVEELQKILLNGFVDNGPSRAGDEEKEEEEEAFKETLFTNAATVVSVSASFLHLLDAGNRRRGWQGGRVADNAVRPRTLPAEGSGVDEGDLRTSQIISVASIAAFNRYSVGGLAYGASKAAATHLGKMLATLLVPWGVRCNVVAPGVYPSAMTAAYPQSFPVSQIPAGRQGTPDEIAAAVLYLVGKGGAYVNGAVQLTDGGRLCGMPSTY
ncbi:hypothetical protein B0J12DRAFT_705166 [Macrophomina phaseolina]|uniref:Short-chain dehydrogenase/reductase SDR n=1 Tax=Macrophomina phaseolina TaxID=35725 RepID=A0ABQ8FT80_9PEZI|nr:hypothetical protein B0J12DRAFT_705166 [Macrophomina phaseolina]